MVGLASTYDGVRRLAGRCLARKRLGAAVGVITALLILVTIALGVLRNFPNSADEYCYLYQARTMAEGRLWNDPHPLQQPCKP